MTSSHFLEQMRPAAASVPFSGISAVFSHGYGKPGLIPLWVGEGELATPDFIIEAARQSLAAGETFYSPSLGLIALREALARYHDRTYGGVFNKPFSPARFLITGSGMQAIQTALAAVAGHGDEVLIPTPAWPNFKGATHISGATPVEVPMTFGNRGWELDFDRLQAAVTPATRAIFVNSPSNPTGWTASRQDIADLLAFARRNNLWIIADQVYGRFYFEGEGVAPGFHEIIEPSDKVIFVNTFSKNWAMTGWRLGWIEAPEILMPYLENIVQYSTSCSPMFVQKAAMAALDGGDSFIERQRELVLANRNRVADALSATGRVRFALPQGAFYLFVAIEGQTDTQSLAFRLVDEANIGVAPGSTFGAAGADYIRLCLARTPDNVQAATSRLVEWMARQ